MNARVTLSLLLMPAIVSTLLAQPPSYGGGELGGHEVFLVDTANGRPVPLVKLQATNGLVWVTDNSGMVCIDAPELMNREIWLSVSSHGYECKADGFGMRGLRIEPKSGGSSKLTIERRMIAERVGRLTGSGLVGESQKLGQFRQRAETGVVGCDSAFVTPWKGKLFWVWGDTNVFHYPLGIFRTLGATSELNLASDYATPLSPQWKYFRGDGNQLRAIVAIENEGPVWLGGLVALKDAQGKEHLVAAYEKIRGKLQSIEVGLCEWDERDEMFHSVRTLWQQSESEQRRPASMLVPNGHATRFVDEQGVEQLLFANPFPQVQLPCTYEAWADPSQWLHPKLVESAPATQGQWTNGTWREKLGIGRVSQEDGQSNQEIVAHRGSMAWSERLSKWIVIFTQRGGDSSFLGEVWLTQSDSPLGPWGAPVRIATHDNYTFYNPVIHQHALSRDSPYVYFEGTYTAEFADRAEETPRYDYNQILYRVNLDELAMGAGR